MGSNGPDTASLAELLAMLSLGTDLGLGQPMEHVLRQCLIVLGLGERIGLDELEIEVAYTVTMLAFVGCHTDSYEQARWFGDDIRLRADHYNRDLTRVGIARHALVHVASGAPPLERARTMAAFLRTGRKDAEAMRMTHCTLASQLASRLGLRESVQDALLQYFERWDGQGEPGDRSGDAIALPVRVVQLADVAEVFHRIGGADAAVEVVRARSGTQFDPEVANAFCTHAGELLAPLGAPASDVVVSAPPGLSTPLSDEESSRVLEAFADFLDLKSPYTLGHSRAVADLAAEAARIAGRPADKVDELRRAGLLHDLGRLGVSNTIWDKAGPLTAAERERVRMQPYLTERMLTASAALAPLGQLAATHQERLDGSGYPRGLKGEALSPEARLLAAADVYQAMREPRAHRAAREPDDAARELRAEVRAGRLDGEAAEAVLRAAGHRASRRPTQPGGLTAREVEVLGLVARGLRSKEIGEQLHITPKTVGHHIGHIYSKIGVTNRAGASLFATEHGLLGQRSEAA